MELNRKEDRKTGSKTKKYRRIEMSHKADAVANGIIGNEKRIAKILRVMAGTSEGSSFATIRKMVVGEAASQKTRLTETEIKSAVYAIYRHCAKKDD